MIALFALASLLAAASPAPAHPAVSPSPSPAPLTAADLFSRRALRQARLIIQMRMLQLHDERLECVRAALLRRLPGALWPEEPSPSRGTSDLAAATAKCAELLKY